MILPKSFTQLVEEKKLRDKQICEGDALRYLIWTIALYVFFIDLMITLPNDLPRIDEALKNFGGPPSEVSPFEGLVSAISKLLFQLPPWYTEDTGNMWNWVAFLRVLDFVCIIGGMIWAYWKNGGKGGFHFIHKFAVLSWAIGIRCLLIYALLRFFLIGLDGFFGVPAYGKWLDIILIAQFYFTLYKWMGRVIQRTKKSKTKEKKSDDSPTAQSDSNQSAEAENGQSGARDV